MRDRRLTNKVNARFNVMGIETRECRRPSLCDCFYTEVHESVARTTAGRKSISFRDPVYMLFNQERLAKMGIQSVEAWLSQFKQAKNTEVQNLLSKCSDSDILKMVKPRNLQSPSELALWARYMNANMKEFNTELKRIQDEFAEAEEQAQAEAQVQAQVETTKSV